MMGAIMNMTLRFLACALFFLSATTVDAQPGRFRVAFPKLEFERPVFLTHVPDGSDRVVVVEQGGRVFIFQNEREVEKPLPALDIRRQVNREGEEEGLLGLVFHPDFAKNRQVFVHYSASKPRRNVLSRLTMNEGAATIDPRTEEVIFEINQPWSNHNGGMIAFGPDGYLYLSLGDGGSANDPLNSGQSLNTLLGKILRLDVDRTAGRKRHAVPRDNPFVGQRGARGEIWAYGLCNVWRFSFDRETGDLWAGDVGQDTWEEIDLITRGGNYGWRIREGKHDFRPREKKPTQMLIDPIVDHDREDAKSITGGYVYRGKAVPELRGAYIYGDYVTGIIWILRYDGDKVTEHRQLDKIEGIASFGEDRDGEIYLCSFDGMIYRLTPRR